MAVVLSQPWFDRWRWRLSSPSILRNAALGVATSGQMAPPVWQVDAQWPSHALKVEAAKEARQMQNAKFTVLLLE